MPPSQVMPDQRITLVTAGNHGRARFERASTHCGSAADCGQNPQRPRAFARNSRRPKWG
jgi:hypothetical protein